MDALGLVLALALSLGILTITLGVVLLMRPAAPQIEPEVKLTRQPRETMNELQRQLVQAGFSHPAAPRLFNLAKILTPIVFVLTALVAVQVPPLAFQGQQVKLVVVFLMFAAGYFLPISIVDRRRAAYRMRIAQGLPDALDLMLVCVEAGQSVDAAVRRVALEMRDVHPDLAEGLHLVTESLAAGIERHAAFLQLAEDTNNEDLRALASVIAQAMTLGTPISQTMRVFAADMRDRRVRQVEEKANLLPTKMTLGTMAFTVPPLLILLMAPAVYRVMNAF